MLEHTIIWDFDGTILPINPYDSEQTLLHYIITCREYRTSLFKRLSGRVVIYADQRGRFPEYFKRAYNWLLKGTSVELLDRVAEELAAKISAVDRQAIHSLKRSGYKMMVLSCGTADLSTRILRVAGLADCFSFLEGNWFLIENGKIKGMDFHIPTPESKLELLLEHGITAEQAVAIGDGYTDLPLLNWAAIPVLLDRTGEKRAMYMSKGYHHAASVPEAAEIVAEIIKKTDNPV